MNRSTGLLISMLLPVLLMLLPLALPARAQSGCYLLHADKVESGDAWKHYWVINWPAGWPTNADQRIALGDFRGWQARIAWGVNSPVSTYVLSGSEVLPALELPYGDNDLGLILDSRYAHSLGFHRRYYAFAVQLCSPDHLIPTPTATSIPLPPPTMTPLPDLPLHMSDVVSVSQGLAVSQAAAWQTDADTFGLFVPLLMLVLMFGLLGFFVALLRQVRARWPHDG